MAVEALYWKPFDVTYFLGQEVTEINPADPIEREARWIVAQPDYHWGARVRGHYLLPCSCVFLAAEYLYHHNTGVADGLTTNGDFVSKVRFEHHAADLAIGNYFITGHCVWAAIFAGARYVFLRSQQTADITIPEGEGDGRCSTWLSAAGPMIGLEGHYCLGVLDLSAQFTAAATAGRRNAPARIDIEFTPSSLVASTIERRYTTLVPSFGGELAAAFCWQSCGTCFQFRAGFAFRRYIQALDPESTSEGCLEGVNVAGPFAGIGVCF